MRMQVRMSGMAGRRKRGSWCGIRLRIRVPVSAEVRRGFVRMKLSLADVKG